MCTVELMRSINRTRLVRLYCFDTVTRNEIRLILKPVISNDDVANEWQSLNADSLMEYLSHTYLGRSLSIYKANNGVRFIPQVYKTIYDKYTIEKLTSPDSEFRVFAIQISDMFDTRSGLYRDTIKTVDVLSMSEFNSMLNDISCYYSINTLIVNAMEAVRQKSSNDASG